MNIEDTNLTIEDLLKIKEDNYKKAVESDKFKHLYILSKVLGKRTDSAYTKYIYVFNSISIAFGSRDITVFNDVYGGYLNVNIGNKLVASNHPTENLFVNSGWYEELLPEIGNAILINRRNLEDEIETKRRELINKIF